jgi:hypothetical protein
VSPTERPPGSTSAGRDPANLATLQETKLLEDLDSLLDLADPVPADLVDRIHFAVDLEDFDVEVARWESIDHMAGVRSHAGPSTITFTVEDLTVMVSLAPGVTGHRFDGWLVPGGPHTIEVRVEGHEASTTTADQGGRFMLDDVPKGFTQIVVHMAAPVGHRQRTVVTPTILR